MNTIINLLANANYVFDKTKAHLLLKLRWIDLQQIVNSLKSLNFCEIQPNPNYPGQYRILIKYKFQ